MRLKEELTKKNLNFKMIRWQDIVLPFKEIPEICLIRGSVDLDIHFAIPYMETIIEELERMGCITIPPIKMITKCDKATTYLLWKKYLKNVIKMPESIITVNMEKAIQFLKNKKIAVFKPIVGGLGRGVELIKENPELICPCPNCPQARDCITYFEGEVPKSRYRKHKYFKKWIGRCLKTSKVKSRQEILYACPVLQSS